MARPVASNLRLDCSLVLGLWGSSSVRRYLRSGLSLVPSARLLGRLRRTGGGSKMILFLVKVFEKEEHARDFVNGEIFANRLFHFKKLEGDEGRGDEYEGAIMPQLEGSIITFKGTNHDTGEVEVNEITITEADLAAPVIMVPEWFDHISVFCMFAGHSGTFEWAIRRQFIGLQEAARIAGGLPKLGRSCRRNYQC